MRWPTATSTPASGRVGAPTSSILNLATTNDIVIIELTDEQFAAAQAADPVFARTTLAGGTYEDVDEDIAVLGVPNVLVVSSEMPDDLAYALTKAMFENIADLQAVHPAANETTVEFTMVATPFPSTPARSGTTRKSAPRSRTRCARESGDRRRVPCPPPVGGPAPVADRDARRRDADRPSARAGGHGLVRSLAAFREGLRGRRLLRKPRRAAWC